MSIMEKSQQVSFPKKYESTHPSLRAVACRFIGCFNRFCSLPIYRRIKFAKLLHLIKEENKKGGNDAKSNSPD